MTVRIRGRHVKPLPRSLHSLPRLSPVSSGSALTLPAQQTRALLSVLIFPSCSGAWFGSTFLRLHNTTIDYTTTVKLLMKFSTYLEKVLFSLSNSRECTFQKLHEVWYLQLIIDENSAVCCCATDTKAIYEMGNSATLIFHSKSYLC